MSGDVALVILSGGNASRVARLAAGRPKALLPVGGAPLVVHHLLKAERFPCRPYLQVHIDNHGFGEELGEWLRALRRPLPVLRTHGDLSVAMRQICDLGHPEIFLVNGDVVSDVDYAVVHRAFRERGASALTVSVPGGAERGCSVPRDWLEVGTEGPPHDLMGLTVIRREFLAAIAERVAYDFWGAVRALLLRAPGRHGVEVLETSARWHDVGTVDRFFSVNLQATELDYLSAPLVARGFVERTDAGSLLARGARVESRAVVRSVVCAGACVTAASRLSRSVVLPGARVDAQVEVADGWLFAPAWAERYEGTVPGSAASPSVPSFTGGTYA